MTFSDMRFTVHIIDTALSTHDLIVLTVFAD